MKIKLNFKLLLALLMFTPFTTPLLAEEELGLTDESFEEVISETSSPKEKSNGKFSISSYGLFSAPLPIGDDGYAEYISYFLGAGLGAEYELPFSLPSTNRLGISIKSFWRYGFEDNSEVLNSLNNLGLTGGFFYKIPLGESPVSFVPEISYGVLFHFVDSDSEYELESIYSSHYISVAPALRFKLPGKADFLSIDAAPTYSLVIDSDGEIQYEVGARLGAVFAFGK